MQAEIFDVRSQVASPREARWQVARDEALDSLHLAKSALPV
jgi:hypothetical protein